MKCEKHQKYKVICPPRGSCVKCWLMWSLKQIKEGKVGKDVQKFPTKERTNPVMRHEDQIIMTTSTGFFHTTEDESFEGESFEGESF